MKYRIGKTVLVYLTDRKTAKTAKVLARSRWGSRYLVKSFDGEIILTNDTEIFPYFSKDLKDWEQK